MSECVPKRLGANSSEWQVWLSTMAALSLAWRTLTTLGLGPLGPLPTCHTQTQDQATAPWAPGLLKTAPTTVPSGVSRGGWTAEGTLGFSPHILVPGKNSSLKF